MDLNMVDCRRRGALKFARACFMLVVAATLFLPAAVRAAPAADALIKQGLELRRAGRDMDALPKFEEAYQQARSPRAAAQWGLCLQAVSRWSEADPLLAEALSATTDPWVRANRAVLKESQEAVKSHVGRVEVLGRPEGAAVSVAGRVVGTLPLASAVAVNEGVVDIEVAAPGHKSSTRTLTVAGASYQRLVFQLDRETAPPATALSNPAASDPAPAADPQIGTGALTEATSDEPKPIMKRPWFWVAAGAVIVAGVVGAVLLSSGKDYPSFNETRSIP